MANTDIEYLREALIERGLGESPLAMRVLRQAALQSTAGQRGRFEQASGAAQQEAARRAKLLKQYGTEFGRQYAQTGRTTQPRGATAEGPLGILTQGGRTGLSQGFTIRQPAGDTLEFRTQEELSQFLRQNPDVAQRLVTSGLGLEQETVARGGFRPQLAESVAQQLRGQFGIPLPRLAPVATRKAFGLGVSKISGTSVLNTPATQLRSMQIKAGIAELKAKGKAEAEEPMVRRQFIEREIGRLNTLAKEGTTYAERQSSQNLLTALGIAASRGNMLEVLAAAKGAK